MQTIKIFKLMGTGLSAKARVQINLGVSQVVDIKQVATFPDIVFPIIWFEDVRIFPIFLIIFIFVINIYFIYSKGYRCTSNRNDGLDEFSK